MIKEEINKMKENQKQTISDIDTRNSAMCEAQQDETEEQLLDQMKSILIADSQGINQLDKSGETLLYKAARNNYINLAQQLIDNGADVNKQKLPGLWTPLHIAAFWENEPMIQLLLRNNANPNAIDHVECTPQQIVEWYARNTSIISLFEDAARHPDSATYNNEISHIEHLPDADAAIARINDEPTIGLCDII